MLPEPGFMLTANWWNLGPAMHHPAMGLSQKQFTLSSKTNKGLSSGWWTVWCLQSWSPAGESAAPMRWAVGEGGAGHPAYPDALGHGGRMSSAIRVLSGGQHLSSCWGCRCSSVLSGSAREKEPGAYQGSWGGGRVGCSGWSSPLGVAASASGAISLVEKCNKVLKSQEPGVISLPRQTSMQGLQVCFMTLNDLLALMCSEKIIFPPEDIVQASFTGWKNHVCPDHFMRKKADFSSGIS